MTVFCLENSPVILCVICRYNRYMRKIKIFITIVVLYEFAMLTVLQISEYCAHFFNHNFCEMDNYKYFLMCVMLPVLIGLVVWWAPEIARLFCPNKCDIKPQSDVSIKNIFNEIISKQDIERFITAAIIMGIQKFATTHPKTEEVFDNILDVLKNTNTQKKKK